MSKNLDGYKQQVTNIEMAYAEYIQGRDAGE